MLPPDSVIEEEGEPFCVHVYTSIIKRTSTPSSNPQCTRVHGQETYLSVHTFKLCTREHKNLLFRVTRDKLLPATLLADRRLLQYHCRSEHAILRLPIPPATNLITFLGKRVHEVAEEAI